MVSAHVVRRETVSCCRIAHTEAVEDTLKAVFSLSARDGSVTTSALAGHLGITPPTASAMLKRLYANGLVIRTEDHLVSLTEHGLRHALDVVRRHRLLEQFLATVLGVPWDEVHDEAEVLEHAVSDALIRRIDRYLGHPTHDPHGDPIPAPGAEHVEVWTGALTEVEPGTRFRVERVSDRDSAALRYLGGLGIMPGTVLDVVERAPFGGPLWVRVNEHSHGLSAVLASMVFGTVA